LDISSVTNDVPHVKAVTIIARSDPWPFAEPLRVSIAERIGPAEVDALERLARAPVARLDRESRYCLQPGFSAQRAPDGLLARHAGAARPTMTIHEASTLLVDTMRDLSAARREAAAYRLLAVVAIHQLHDQRVGLEQLPAVHARLSAECRGLREQILRNVEAA
jgi:hypothetical protein